MKRPKYQPPADLPDDVPVFRGEWDDEGVYFYQAYSDAIADYALEHQTFGGPAWKLARMTWIKPSFAWMLYRSGYGSKAGQTRVLKIKLSHHSVAYLLSKCKLTSDRHQITMNKATKVKGSTEEKGIVGRVQWDPERDIYQSEENEPRRMLQTRAIQIGLSGQLSIWYVNNIISVQEVTDLAHKVGVAHKLKTAEDVQAAMKDIKDDLPDERPYFPSLSKRELQELAMLPGTVSSRLGD